MRVFDAHCDTLDLLNEHSTLYDCDCHYNLCKAGEYDTHIQVAAIWVDGTQHNVASRADALIERYDRETKDVLVIKTREDLKNACGVCVILGIEGGEAAEGSIQRLRDLFGRGVRLITLTWNHQNEISGTAFENGGGLTPFGREAINEMERLGMMVDVSHLSDRGFYDVLEVAKRPFIASHSNSRSVCGIFRNLTDEQFKCLAKGGGVAGINLCPDFLGESPNVDTVVAHIEHFMALGGEDSVGIGADFDGIPALPQGINGTEDLGKIFNRLLNLNYSEAAVEKIAFLNMERVFMEVLP